MTDYSELNPSNWLQKLLSKKTNDTVSPAPTGNPLYSYQVTQNEYENLKEILQTFVRDFDLLKRNQTLCACFVLYCSEWWRRSFQGGAWSWSELLAEIEIDESEVNKPTLYEVCEKGLFFWKRKVLSSNAGRREFLGTFAAEGGLPINQLNSPNNWIERVLKTALNDYLRFGTDIYQILEQRFEVVNVPATFKDVNSSLIETLASIVEAVYQLNVEYNLAQQAHPESYLNGVEPEWREQFPIPLDSEQGRLLLDSLIKNASKTISKQKEQKSVFRLNRIARVIDNELRFEASVEIPSKLVLDFNLTHQIKSFVTNNPIVIDIEVFLPNQQRQIIARGRLTSSPEDDNFEYQLQQLKKLSVKENPIAMGAFGLFLRLRNQERIAYPLDSGYQLDLSEPMVFEDTLADGEEISENQGFQLLAFAESLSVREERALVFIPESSAQFDSSEAMSFCPKYSLEQGLIVEFSGQMSVMTDATYLYKTKYSGSSYQFELIGNVVEYAKNPSLIYKGVPKVTQINIETGFKSSIYSNGFKIRVRPYGENALWQIPNSELVGQYEIAVFGEQNQMRFKRRIGVVPKNFSVTLNSREDVSQGQVVILGLEGAFAFDNSIRVEKQDQSPDRSSIDIKSVKAEPNETFDCFIGLPNRVKSLEFTFPFPAIGARLFDPNGEVLSASVHTLLLNQLQGYRLKVFRSQQRDVSVLFQLKDTALNCARQDFEIERRYRFGDVRTRLMSFNVLDWVEEIHNLLKHGESIDALVVIEISMNHERLCRLEIKNYLIELERDSERQFVLLKDASLNDFESISLEAFRLDAPEQKSVILTQRHDNEVLYPMWDVSTLYKKDADWLIQTQQSQVYLRPILWSTHQPAEGFDQTDQVFSLKEVVRISNRVQRLKAFDETLTAMAEDLNHKDWHYFRDFNIRSEGQPIEAFDLYRVISKHTLFLASICLQEEFHELLNKIQESLYVNWYLISLDNWEKAYLSTKNFIEQNIQNEELEFVKNIMQKQIDLLLDNGFSQIKQGAFDAIKTCLAGKASLPITFDVFRALIVTPRNKLVQRCADDNFPERLSGTVYWYVEKYQLNDLQTVMQSDNPSYRLPVLMMPIILAHTAIYESELWLKLSQRFELQKIIDFDQEWFEAAFNFAFGYFQFQKMEAAA